MRPRLLFVAPWFLFPANNGGRIRTRDILRGMKGGVFEITLVSPDSGQRQAYKDELSDICDRFVGWTPRGTSRWSKLARLRHLIGDLPVSVASDYCRPAKAAIAKELLRAPNLLVVDFVHTAVLLPKGIEVPSVIFTHNVEPEIFRRHAEVAKNAILRAVWRQQYAKMARFEKAQLGRFDSIVAVSERDRAVFRTDYALSDVFIIPTGVSPEYFDGAGTRNTVRGEAADREPSVVFSGSMDWMPNIDAIEYFMEQVWPLVQSRKPNLQFTIVGRDPPKRLIRAAESRGLPWTFTGAVEDVRPFVRNASVYVIPLRVGGGTRLKVFEAAAMGRPIVSTSIGVEGLDLMPGHHFLAADEPATFAESILNLLEDSKLAARLAEEAQTYVAEHFSAKTAALAFESICQRTAGLEMPRRDRGSDAALRP